MNKKNKIGIAIIIFWVFVLSCCVLNKGKKSISNNGTHGIVSTDSIKSIISSNNSFSETDTMASVGIEPEKGHSVGSTGSSGVEYNEEEDDDNSTSSANSNTGVKIVDIPSKISTHTHLEEGRVVYNIPQKMKIRTTYQVVLRISKSKKTILLLDSLKGIVKTSVIPVTQTMEVKLIDPSPADEKMFEIVSDDDAVQMIEYNESYTQWTWDVTPVRVGNSKLKIVVSVIRDGNRKDVVYQDAVEVEKDTLVQIEFFWKEYWKWIIGTIIVPIVGWYFKRKYDKKEKGNDGNDNKPA